VPIVVWRYYYFTFIGKTHDVGYRIRKCTEDFPLKKVLDENPERIITFWNEISETEGKKFEEGEMSRDDAPCKCNGTGFIGNLICDCTFRKAGLGINKERVLNTNVEMDVAMPCYSSNHGKCEYPDSPDSWPCNGDLNERPVWCPLILEEEE